MESSHNKQPSRQTGICSGNKGAGQEGTGWAEFEGIDLNISDPLPKSKCFWVASNHGTNQCCFVFQTGNGIG